MPFPASPLSDETGFRTLLLPVVYTGFLRKYWCVYILGVSLGMLAIQTYLIYIYICIHISLHP